MKDKIIKIEYAPLNDGGHIRNRTRTLNLKFCSGYEHYDHLAYIRIYTQGDVIELYSMSNDEEYQFPRTSNTGICLSDGLYIHESKFSKILKTLQEYFHEE